MRKRGGGRGEGGGEGGGEDQVSQLPVAHDTLQTANISKCDTLLWKYDTSCECVYTHVVYVM